MQIPNPVIPDMTFNYRRDIKPVGRVHVPLIVWPLHKFKIDLSSSGFSQRKQTIFVITGKIGKGVSCA